MIYPLKLNTDIEYAEIAPGISLEQVEPQYIWSLFGYKDVFIKKNSRGASRIDGSAAGLAFSLNDVLEFYDAKYVVRFKPEAEGGAWHMARALRTFVHGSPSIWIGRDEGQTCYFPVRPLYESYAFLAKNEVLGFSNYFQRLCDQRDERIGSALSLFDFSASRPSRGFTPPILNRFLNLTMILESFFGRESGTEISFRVSLSVALFGSTVLPKTGEEIYETVRRIYDVRNSCIHRGDQSPLTEEVYLEAYTLCLVSIRHAVSTGSTDAFKWSETLKQILG